MEKKARRRTSSAALEKLTVTTEDGTLQILNQPPLTTRRNDATPEQLTRLWEAYRRSCAPEVRYLLGGFAYADHALRVVGVGSVGTRCYILLFTGPGGEPIFLQAKEAGASVLET